MIKESGLPRWKGEQEQSESIGNSHSTDRTVRRAACFRLIAQAGKQCKTELHGQIGFRSNYLFQEEPLFLSKRD